MKHMDIKRNKEYLFLNIGISLQFIVTAAFFVVPVLRDLLGKLPLPIRIIVIIAPALIALVILLRFTYLTKKLKIKIPLFSGWFMPVFIFGLYVFIAFFPPPIH